MNDIDMFEAIRQLRPDEVADYIRTTRESADALLRALPGEMGHGLRGRIFGAPLYKAMVTHAETLSIRGWTERDELLDSWHGLGVTVLSVSESSSGTFVYRGPADDSEYKKYELIGSNGTAHRFVFGDVLEATVNPDGKRFIIIG